MDLTPRRVMHLVREGFRDEVLSSQTIWLCSSCYSCTVECPRGIQITDVMYALKREAIEQGVYPKRFPIPVLAEQFQRMVKESGRTSETRLAMRLFLRTSWLEILRGWRLGINLMRTGRLGLFERQHVREPGRLARMLNHHQN